MNMSAFFGSSLAGAGDAACACALARAAARISARLASRALNLPAYDLSSSSSLARASSATVASAPVRNPIDVLSASRRVFASPSRVVARATTRLPFTRRDAAVAFARGARGFVARTTRVVAVATVNDISIVCARVCAVACVARARVTTGTPRILREGEGMLTRTRDAATRRRSGRRCARANCRYK